MPLILVRNDITRMAVDAIVAPGNTELRGGGGADGMIRAVFLCLREERHTTPSVDRRIAE